MTLAWLSVGVRAGVLVLLGAVSGFILNAIRPEGATLAAAPPATCTMPAFELPIQRMDPARANALCSDPGVLVADARSPLRFAEGHVANAVHLPCGAAGEVARSVPALLQGKHTVIVYGDDTEGAVAVADGLRRRTSAGAIRVVVLDGGFAAWERAGLACASGPCPDCADDLHSHPEPRETPAP